QRPLRLMSATFDPDGVTSFRTTETRSGWVRSLPRGEVSAAGDEQAPALIAQHRVEATSGDLTLRGFREDPSDLPLASPRRGGWQVGSAFPSSCETPRLPGTPLRVGMGFGHGPRRASSSLKSCSLESHCSLH